MKIEKLTENKIRVIVKPSDLEMENMDLHLLMTKALEGKNFFATMLEKAKQEVGFNADGCKLLIEAFTSSDDILVFTITKYSYPNSKEKLDPSKKHLTVKRKTFNFSNKQAVFQFENFDTFCDFCEYIHCNHNFDVKKFSKNISLFLYHNTYYLVVKNINPTYEHAKSFYSMASEFATILSSSIGFENKLLEHGKVIMRKNAIEKGIEYFVTKSNS